MDGVGGGDGVVATMRQNYAAVSQLCYSTVLLHGDVFVGEGVASAGEGARVFRPGYVWKRVTVERDRESAYLVTQEGLEGFCGVCVDGDWVS